MWADDTPTLPNTAQAIPVSPVHPQPRGYGNKRLL
jgi:hypothetical protein